MRDRFEQNSQKINMLAELKRIALIAALLPCTRHPRTPGSQGGDMRTLRLTLCAICLAWLATPALAAKAKYEEGEVSGGGAIEGSVVYHGAVKKRTILPTKDKKVCGRMRKDRAFPPLIPFESA